MKITAKKFKAATGYRPTQDDLQRCNCKKVFQIGHYTCGWCSHNKPVFMCLPCFDLRAQGIRH